MTGDVVVTAAEMFLQSMFYWFFLMQL